MPRPQLSHQMSFIVRWRAGHARPLRSTKITEGCFWSVKNILKKMALLAIPVLLWLAFFIAFEPNNYFGLKASATSSQPVARVRAYQQDPGTNLILGDSRLAHFDMGLVDSLSGQSWQNLAFGGASLKETLDLADYLLDSGHDADTLLVEVSALDLHGIYHMVGVEAMSKYLFGVRIAEKFGFDAGFIKPVSINQSGLKAARSPNLTLSTKKLQQAIQHDLPDFNEGLQKFYDQYRRGYPQYIKSLV